MEYREKILSLARLNPVLPNMVAKALNTDSILAGAMLSEMSSKGLLKISKLKVGGSPLYYIPGNEEQLLRHLQGMNEKDRKTVELLKAEKIMSHKEADPLTQVSLTKIKDFAKPLNVVINGSQETFWKWYSVTDQEAEQLIKEKIMPTPKPIEKPVLAPVQKVIEKPIIEEPINKPVQKSLVKKSVSTSVVSEDFWDEVQNFFSTNKIKIIEQTVVKKKTDYDIVVELPSPVGTLQYYCKARGKKKIGDADISAAYVQGQLRKLPILFLTNGELTKKAQTVLSQLKGIIVKQV